MITRREWVEGYRDGLSKVSRRAIGALGLLVERIDPDDEEALQKAQQAMFAVCESADMQAAALAAAFYDGLRELQIGEPFGAEAMSSYNATATAIATAGIMKDGLTESAKEMLRQRVEYEIRKSAGDCIMANAAKENGEDV